ncbi:Endonuclease/exonuclease/phosphatase [Pisolithus thermaeus]|nr:Endonuclease/exonuclease/phosphatase [Pisolithus thermaeus]
MPCYPTCLPPPPDQRFSGKEIVKIINSSLKQKTKASVVVVKWNDKGNCIVIAHPSFTAEDLLPYNEDIAKSLLDHRALDGWTARPDKKWHRVLIHGVDTSKSDIDDIQDLNDFRGHSASELEDELLTQNPFMAGIHLMEPPRWIAHPETLRQKMHSSIVLTVSSQEEVDFLLNVGGAFIVMAYVRRRNDFTVTLRSDLASDADLQILQIDQPPHMPIIVANVYNQRANNDPQSWTFDRFANITFPANLPVVISGDWNLHHPLWSTTDYSPSAKAEALVDWMFENGFVILNDKGSPTYFSHDGMSLSTLDLTFANHAAITGEAVCNWRVDWELSCDSDHFALTWSINRANHPIDNVTAQKFKWKDVDKDKRIAWKAKYTAEVNERWWIFDQLASSEYPSTQTLEIAANELQNAITAAMKAHIPVRKDSKNARPWWSNNLTNCLQDIHDLHHAAVTFRSVMGESDPTTTRLIKTARNHFKRRVREAKKKWIKEELQKTDPNEVWNFAKWPKGIRQYPTPAIN